MPIPRHRNVMKSKAVEKTITHKFEFHRSDLLRLLRLPEDAKLTVVSADGSVSMEDVSKNVVLFAECLETR